MGWKNLPAWVKGGIIGLIVGVIIEIPLFFLLKYCLDNSTGGDWFGSLFCYVFFFPGTFLTGDFFIGVMINILIVTILSIIIGWIYGKIKNK